MPTIFIANLKALVDEEKIVALTGAYWSILWSPCKI